MTMKPTVQDEIQAIDAMLFAIRFDLKDDRMWAMYTPGCQQIIEREIKQLETRKQRLINPPAPKQPRKPKAPETLLDSTVYVKPPTANKATFEPDDTYVNSNPKTGRQGRMANQDSAITRPLPVIECYIDDWWQNDCLVVAIDTQDDELLASHVSSDAKWAKHDIGITSDRKHDAYRTKYPNGYELHWKE